MADDEVLTEEESDALLEQSADSDAPPVPAIQDPGDDFWEQVSRDRIPALDTLNAGIADTLLDVWKSTFGREIVVTPQLPRLTDGRRMAAAIEFDETVGSFELSQSGQQCLLVLQPDTVSAMVDICFGGPGSGARSERLAALTEMEGRLFERFTEALHKALNDTWRATPELSLQESEQAFDSSSHALCDPGVRAVICRFVFDIGQQQHAIDFVWPQRLVDSLSSSAPKALPASGAGSGPDWSGQIATQVKGARLELRAVIGGISVRLHEISSAKAGDIIMTEQLDRIFLYAGAQPVFEGTLGSHEGFNAVKISRPYIQKRSGDI